MGAKKGRTQFRPETPKSEAVMEVKILIPFRVEIDRKAVEFEPGVAELPDALVDAFVNAGYVKMAEAEPAVKVVHKPSAKVKAVK